MPTFKKRLGLELTRSIRLFLYLETGVTGLGETISRLGSRRGAKQDPEKPAAETPVDGSQAKPQQPGKAVAEQQDKLAAQNQKLKRARQQLARRDQELADAREELAQTKSAATSEGSSTEAPPMFFVVGLAKSGTSWLMNTLDSHPEILCKGEGRFFSSDPRSLRGLLMRQPELEDWLARNPWSSKANNEMLLHIIGAAARNLMQEKLREVQANVNLQKRVVGDKTPLLDPEIVEQISATVPEAKVVHITRDGRDTAVSLMHHVWNRSTDRGGRQALLPGEKEKRDAYYEGHQKLLESGEGLFTEERLRQVARNWNLRVGKTIEDGAALFGASYAEVRYEDLLERPHEEVEKLARFLGADTSEEAIEQAVSSASFEKSTRGRQRGQEDPSSFFRKGVAGDWKNYFTERDKQIFKEEAGDLLIRLGYEKDCDW